MFAFLIWDKVKNELIGARDRLGKKPLYYFSENGITLFASEIKSLLASGLVEKRISKKALFQLFQYGHIRQPNSIFENISSTPPGCYFILKENTDIVFKEYWTFRNSKEEYNGKFEDACADFKRIFEEAVRLRMVSEKSVGVFLSSGLDSAAILAALKNLKFENVNTYTVGFLSKHSKFYSEEKKAKEISSFFGFSHKAIFVNDEDVVKDFPEFVWSLDQPSIDGFNSYVISKYSQDSITVALSGLGADELLMGYSRNIYTYIGQVRGNKICAWLNEKYQKHVQEGRIKPNKYLQAFFLKFGSYNNLGLNYWINNKLERMHETAMKFRIPYKTSVAQEIESFKISSTSESLNLINEITKNELRTYTQSQLLRDTDCVTMYNSMEARLPFLDDKLVEYVLSLPSDYKFKRISKVHDYRTGKVSYAESGVKYILAKTYENVLPKNFLNTSKQGFQLPIYEWAYRYLEVSNYSIFSNKFILENFNKSFLKQKMKYLDIQKAVDKDIYLLLIVALWSDKFGFND
jgi:asparagine synthase (glutamine-hydrolysing)